jgi:hypothetical protein
MYHRLKFLANYRLDLLMPGQTRLEQLMIRESEVIEAQVRPHVQETQDGPVEVADLYMPQEGTLIDVPMACFQFE